MTLQDKRLNRRSLLSLGAAGAALAASPQALARALPRVMTAQGPVTGVAGAPVETYLGLAYAAPPVGGLRFAPPRPPPVRSELTPATAFGHAAIQMPSPSSVNPTSEIGKALQAVFPVRRDVDSQSEDCLYLNVWTRKARHGRNRPVMVWLHGGGFAYGSGAWATYDGASLADRGDVVVVTINHRLNVFGYLNLPGVPGSGNAGMLDIVAALDWVKANIAAFGGDPGNVTSFGESGGGAKVSYLMAMPAARGLFHRAIIQSGPGVRAVPADRANGLRADLAAVLGLAADDVAGLRAVPSEKLLAAAYEAEKKQPGAGFERTGFAPVVDGAVLPAQPWDPAAPEISADVPVLIGLNKDEMTLFMASAPWFGKLDEAGLMKMAGALFAERAGAVVAALKADFPDYSPTYLACHLTTYGRMFAGSVQIAERKAALGRAKAWFYLLEWETPVGPFKSPHTLEIPLVFANVDKARVQLGAGPEPDILAAQMSGAWLAFAKSGNPNTALAPKWPAYEPGRRATMMFNVKSRVVDDPYAATRRAVVI